MRAAALTSPSCRKSALCASSMASMFDSVLFRSGAVATEVMDCFLLFVAIRFTRGRRSIVPCGHNDNHLLRARMKADLPWTRAWQFGGELLIIPYD